MKILTDFFGGFKYALLLVQKKNLYLYFSPAIILALLFYFFFSGGKFLGGGFSFMEDWWVIGWLITSSKTLFGLISFMLFEFFILVLLSPINAYFAEKTKEDLTGKAQGFSLGVFLRSFRRMIVILIVGFILQLGLTILLWFLSFIFGEFFYEVAGIMNIAFFVGYSFFDFGLELEEVSSRKSWKYARKNWMICILLGLVFNLGIYLPQKHGLIMLYALAIAVLPNLLSIVASKIFYDNLPKNEIE